MVVLDLAHSRSDHSRGNVVLGLAILGMVVPGLIQVLRDNIWDTPFSNFL
jgi:hypothetical protein